MVFYRKNIPQKLIETETKKVNFLDQRNMNQELKHHFIIGPMVSFKSSRKISSYSVRKKLHKVKRLVESLKCKRPRS